MQFDEINLIIRHVFKKCIATDIDHSLILLALLMEIKTRNHGLRAS